MTDQDIDKLKSSTGIFNYKGCLVTRIIGGWELFGQKTTSPEGVEEIMLNATSSLSESIVVLDKGNWGVSNTEK